MAATLEASVQQAMGQLVYQLAIANTQIAQLVEQVAALEAKLAATPKQE